MVFWKCSGGVPEVFWGCSGGFQGVFRECSGEVLGVFLAPGVFQECSGGPWVPQGGLKEGVTYRFYLCSSFLDEAHALERLRWHTVRPL